MMNDNSTFNVYQVNIALMGNPKIWRVIYIPQNYMFSDLHKSIQCVMDWSNSHLYEFRIFNRVDNKEKVISIPDDEYPSTELLLDSRRTSISEIFDKKITKLRYIYDMGDYWVHYIEIKQYSLKCQGIVLPVCKDGNGETPIEDIGGMDGYKFYREKDKNVLLKETVVTNVSDLQFQGQRKKFIKENVNFWKMPIIKDAVQPPLTLPNQECEFWLRSLLQGNIPEDEVVNKLCSIIPVLDIKEIYQVILTKHLRIRNRAIIILGYAYGISKLFISEYLFIPKTTIRDLLERCEKYGFTQALYNKKIGFKHEKKEYIDKVFSILHAPPSSYGFNRTSWRQLDIMKVMTDEGLGISKGGLRQILRNSGYSYRKARTVLTSNDPDYKEKLVKITKILSNLGDNEKFFLLMNMGLLQLKYRGESR